MDKGTNDVSVRARLQKMGGSLSNMVMPNIGAFIAWGLITALFLSTGWIPNEYFAELIDPMKIYMLPMLIGFMAGYNVYDIRGGVIGAVATMGAVIGSDIPMFMGAMIVGPIASVLLKKLDGLLDGHIPAGLEMLVNNFSSGILGMILALISYTAVGPFFQFITDVLTTGVNWIIGAGLIPLANVFIEPAKVLFLNNAINHGILGPIGLAQAGETGKSILFLLEPNPGPSLGMLMAFALFGKGTAKSSAPGVAIITSIGGIHEPYFPFVLMKPVMILAMIAGGVTGASIFSALDCGLVATASPGSFFSILAVAPKSDYIPILIGIFASAAVSFAVAAFILKFSKDKEEDGYEEAIEKKNAMKAEGKSEIPRSETSVSENYNDVKEIIFACDAGMGSSAMGASILKKKLKEAGIDIPVRNLAINKLHNDANILVVTQEALLERAKGKTPDSIHETVGNFMNSPTYDLIVEKMKAQKSGMRLEATADSESVSASLVKKNIKTGCHAKDSDEAICEVGKLLLDAGYIDAEYIQGMLNRDHDLSVYIGNQIAIPHAENAGKKYVKETGIAVMVYPDGLDWHGETVKIVIGIAAKGDEHLEVLAHVAQTLYDEEMVEKVIAGSSEEIYQILTAV